LRGEDGAGLGLQFLLALAFALAFAFIFAFVSPFMCEAIGVVASAAVYSALYGYGCINTDAYPPDTTGLG
jgi:hypothetical protein